ncbi:DNA polymerase, partial [Plakobranchus ocellatus]
MSNKEVESLQDSDAVSLAQGRSRRQKIDKKGRSSAFEKLRQAKEKGVKNKYEIQEEQNVYDVVEEEEYSDLVRQRQEDDWIVDDDGGYVEDGREIFDDEMDESAPVRPGQRKADTRKKNKNIVRPGTKPKQDIKSMFAAAAVSTKRKAEKEISLANDDILDDLMGELSKGAVSGNSTGAVEKSSKVVRKPAYNPFQVEKTILTAPSPKTSSLTVPERTIKRELLFSSEKVGHKKPPEKTEKGKKNVAVESPEWTTVKVKEEAVEEMVVVEQMEKDPVKLERDDQATSAEVSSIDFEDDDHDFPQHEEVDGKMSIEESKAPLISEELLSVGWENVGATDGQSSAATVSSDVQVDSSQLPLVADSAGEQVLRFYWLDAFEDPFRHPGMVYLFGKVYMEKAKSYVSCCVTVKNIERRIFILPRVKRVNLKTNQELSEEVTMPMVYEEFSKIAEKNKIDKFRSMKVKKKYAFELMDVPVEADYLEVRYSADLTTLPTDLKGETFSHVFGTKTSSLELLLLNRKMKGPAWLDLKCPQVTTTATSWCKLEAIISKPEHVCVSDVHLPPPPLTVMSLNLQTLPNPKTKQNEIVAAACLLHTDFYMDKPAPKQIFQQHFCVITKPSDCIFPFDFKDQVKKQEKKFTVEIMPNERALLAFLLARIHRYDPDLLVGHDIYGFDLDVLLHRISANKIPHWSKISRLKRTVMPKLGHGQGRATFAEKTAVCGRMMCDVQISARELIRCRSYDLTVLTSDVLKQHRIEADYEEVKSMFQSSGLLLKLIELTLQDSSYILRIMYELNVIPLALQITSICGNIMSRTLLAGRSERNEWLLLHAFHEKQYICPDKEFKKKQAPVAFNEDDEELDQGGGKKTNQGRRKPAYSGGLVLEPKKGFYDTFILLLDFNSLYPSIIQEYNICFTTISRSETENQAGEEEDEANLILPDPDLEPGVLPVEIRKLVDSRKQVKSLMKGSDVSQELMMQYDIRQKALKLTANSMYGCLGFSYSRFYAKPLAALVTGKGREILMKTKDLVQG